MSEQLTPFKLGYAFSKDYKRLHDLLAQHYEVVCFVDYSFDRQAADPYVCRDVCTARCFPEGKNHIAISARGVQYNCYCFLEEKEKFVEDCQRMNLEFIDIEVTTSE